MECISAVDDIKISKGHLCRCVVRQEVIIFIMSILFLAPDPMEVAKRMQPEDVFLNCKCSIEYM